MSVKTDDSSGSLAATDNLLNSHYRRLLLAIAFPLFVVVLTLAVNQYNREKANVLKELEQNSAAMRMALDAVISVTIGHVAKMQSAYTDCLRHPPTHPPRLFSYLQRNTSIDAPELTMDSLPKSQIRLSGQLIRLDPIPDSQAQDYCALALFEPIRLDHQVNPYFQWSYFLSAKENMVAIYPWMSSTHLSTEQGFTSVPEAIRSWFQYDVFRGVLPTANPDKAMHWTAPYFDVVGAGAMISLGAPIYHSDTFIGGVGTDIKLSTLAQFLQSLPRKTGRLLIISHLGMVLADTSPSAEQEIVAVDSVLPDLGQALPVKTSNNYQKISVPDNTLLLRQTDNAPWTLAYVIKNQELQNLLLPRLAPYGVILVALALACVFALFLLRREFINPALSLVDYIQGSAQDPTIKPPKLPWRWQTWAEVIADTVKRKVQANRDLRLSEERLQQILNNSSALICVRDPEGCFISVNRSFQSLLENKNRNVIGKPLEQVLPLTEAQAIFATDQLVLQDNVAREVEEQITQQDGVHTYLSNKFPLFDADGEVYAVCSVSTDITREKTSQQVLQEAAFGISRAKGDEVFDVLVSHLSAAFGTKMALIGLLDETHEHIHTRSLCNDAEIASNIVYSTADSPCIKVANNGYHCFSQDLVGLFPGCNVVQTFGFESYAGVPLISASGETLGILAVLDDYTLPDTPLLESVLKIFSARAVSELERERSYAAMKRSEASYRAIFETSENAILVQDLKTWEILDVNPKACERYGYTRDEMLNVTVGDISSGIAPYSFEEASVLLQRAAEGERLRFEWQRRERNGEIGWDEVFLRRATIGGIDRILAITNDISDRKLSEERMRTSEAQYRAIFNASSDALLVVDSAGNVVDTNDRYCALTGYTLQETQQQPLSEFFDHSENGELLRPRPLHEQAGTLVTEAGMRCRNGSILESEVRVMPVEYHGVSHTLVISRDITELKSAEQELARQRDALRQSEKLSAMGALLAGVAHELNNPLAILMGRSALLQGKITQPQLINDVEKINAAAERCARIVHTFLAMARQRPTKREPSHLNDVVMAALDLLGYSLRASDIQIESNLQPGLPMVDMDGDQIGQVVMNLIVNAQQALANQTGRRRIRVETFSNQGSLGLRVADNGPGIPDKVRTRIFDPFFTTKAAGVGTGVGLSVSRGIVREHEGELTLEQNPNWTSLLVKLPITSQQQLHSKPTDNLAGLSETSTILIVDDEAEVTELLAEILQSAGFITTEATSGRSAIDWLANHHCDFILSDIRMPDMDGIALWRHLSEHHPYLSKRIAFVTGDTLSSSIAPFLQENELLGLDKPFTPDDVLALITKLETR